MSDYFLADDLSGALDAAAGFHAAGRPVRIVWSTEAWDAAPANVVVGFTTETRNARPEDAAAIVNRVVQHGRRRGAQLRYKKIDSTLRGAVAAELSAVLAALEARILFTPANPRVGRTVRDGVLLVKGVPVAETEFGRDPASPVRESSLRALLAGLPVGRVEIADVESEHDLSEAVGRMERTGAEWIGVGSGALARPVAAAKALRPSTGAATAAPLPVAASPRLMVCGSAHPLNRDQAAELTRAAGVPVCEVSVADPAKAVRGALAALGAGGAASILLASERIPPDRALHAIARAASEIVAAARVGRLFVTGGETAFALCQRLGVEFLEYAAELEAGLSLSVGRAGHRPLLLAIKPGGFGDVQTWIRAWRALGGAASE